MPSDTPVPPRRISVFGATGSIGSATLDLVRREPERWSVVALTANAQAAPLAEAALAVGAEVAVVADPDAYGELKTLLSGSRCEAAAGPEAVLSAAARPTDIVVSAIVGVAGLAPSLAMLGATRNLALANKETLVAAGSLFMDEARRLGTRILPVDSEHNAIFQVLEENQDQAVAEIVLTASGGPFRTLDADAMARVTVDQALKHPNWTMGRKVTIDSATLMNKGLELIEAHHLFGVGPERLGVLVHPQSVVHGMVRYTDGSLLAQLGAPDMRTPIGYCLSYPDRRATPVVPLDLARLGTLTFEAPDRARFPCLALAEAAMADGGGAPCVLNAANEIAVEAFLDRKVGYTDIPRIVERALSRLASGGMMQAPRSLADVSDLDDAARRAARDAIAR